MKFALPLLFITSSALAAEPIQTFVKAQVDKLTHVAVYVQAANTEKPAHVILDKAVPYTDKNQGNIEAMEGLSFSAEHLQTEGPVQILYQDFSQGRTLIPCGGGIAQDQGGKTLIKINVDMKFIGQDISCLATGEYKERAKAEKEDEKPATNVAQIQSQK